MKTWLPVLFSAFLCLPGIARAGNDTPPTLEFSADVRQGCHFLAVAFSDETFTSGGYEFVSYTWDFGDGTTLTTTDGWPTHTYASAGIYDVTMSVVSTNGWTGSLTKNAFIKVGDDFAVNLGPDTAVCGVTPLIIDASTSGATYLWSQDSTTASIIDSTGGSYSVTVNKYGCVATGSINITRTILSVDLGPDQDICDNSTLTLSSGNPAADVEWSTGETDPDITVWDEGEYYVTVTKDGCVASDTIQLAWKPEISLNFGFQKVGGCLPADIKFTDSSAACTGSIVGWLWDFGDGSTSTEQNPTHSFTSKGQFPVRLTVTASSGSTSFRTKKVIIDPPAIAVDLGADTTICFGESLTLDAVNPGATYAWNTGETTQQVTVLDDGNYSVTVNVDGCIAKDTIAVRTSASAVSNFGYAAAGNCLPVTVSFSDSSMAFCGQSIVSYKWTFGDGATSTQRNPVHVYNTADSFNVRLMVTSSGGTTSTKTKRVVVTNTTFNVDIPDTVAVCRGGTVTLDATVTGAQYAWSPSFGLSATDIRNPVLTPVADSWYRVDVTKCSVTRSDSVRIIMDSAARPQIVQEGNSLKSPEAVTYQWLFGGTVIDGAVSRAIRVDRAGYYLLRIVNRNGCVIESDPFFYMPVSGREKTDKGFRMKISPNPARGSFNILLSEIPSKAAAVRIYDANGKNMLITSIRDHVNTISAMKLSKGLYFVEIIIDGNRTMMPVVIQ